jgi:hypothetical protein
MNGVIQYRYTQGAQVRASADKDKISGYGVVFNADSAPLTVFDGRNGRVNVIERITQESVKDADMSDVISAFNHNFEKILGRSTSGTLTMSTDKNGIMYNVRLGSQTYASDLLETLQRGDVSGSSFVFLYDAQEGYEFEEREDGAIVATIKKITKIIEMGPVVNPAYPTTTAQGRSSDMIEGVKRFLSEKETPIEEILDEVNEDGGTKRALDVEEMMSMVGQAFYVQFDGVDEKYYYIKSIMVDDTMVVKEYPSCHLFKLSFSMSEDQTVTFSDMETWEQVQKEYIPVRDYYHDKEIDKRTTDHTGEEEIKIVYPFQPGHYRLKAIAKRRV